MDFYYDSLLANNKYTYRLLGPTYNEKTSTFNSKSYCVIIRDFIREPLSFQIDHSWTGIEAGRISSAMSTLQTSWGSARQNVLSKMAMEGANINGFAFQDFMSASDYVKVFKATNISLPLSLSTVLISDGVNVASERLTKLLNYFLGTVEEEKDDQAGSFTQRVNDLIVKVNAPHGFKNITATNEHAVNSLMLYYGDTAWLDDLIVTNVRVDMSKEMGYDGSPQTITVNFNLSPCRLFSAKELKNFVASATASESTIKIPTIDTINITGDSYV